MSAPPDAAHRAGTPILDLPGRNEFARHQGFCCAKTLGTPDSRRDNVDVVLLRLLLEIQPVVLQLINKIAQNVHVVGRDDVGGDGRPTRCCASWGDPMIPSARAK